MFTSESIPWYRRLTAGSGNAVVGESLARAKSRAKRSPPRWSHRNHAAIGRPAGSVLCHATIAATLVTEKLRHPGVAASGDALSFIAALLLPSEVV